jgi:hypothetical protein
MKETTFLRRFRKTRIAGLLALCFFVAFALPASAQAGDYPHGPTLADKLYVKSLNLMNLEMPGVISTLTTAGPAPTGTIFTPGEYEPNEGMIITWQAHTGIITEMCKAVTDYSPDTWIFMIVENSSQQTSA